MRLIKKVITFIKKNPVMFLSITAFIALLIYNNLPGLKRTINKIMKPEIKTWQLPLRIKTWVTSKFGIRKDPVTGSVKSNHNGIDLHAPAMTEVFSPFGGVVKSFYSSAGGNQVLITHSNGYTTGFAHLTEVLVPSGTVLQAGQMFAYSGNSGDHTTAAHLHFTLRDPKGKQIDPLEIFNFPLKA